MSRQRISRAKRKRVAAAFRWRCAYCQTAERIVGPVLEIDHILPESQGGDATEANLALACPLCNSHKASQTTAIDPESNQPTALFHPRLQKWEEHFEWVDGGAVIRGKTPVGRATVAALKMNHTDAVATRRLWAEVGWHPPRD